MQFCQGGDLAKRIHKQGAEPFDYAKIVQWFDQLSQGVKFIHAGKIVHRDIKVLFLFIQVNHYIQPQNVMIDQADNVLLADFGLANVIEMTGRSKFVCSILFVNHPFQR